MVYGILIRGTIRGDMSTDIERNVVHSTDSKDNTIYGINNFFKCNEIFYIFECRAFFIYNDNCYFCRAYFLIKILRIVIGSPFVFFLFLDIER